MIRAKLIIVTVLLVEELVPCCQRMRTIKGTGTQTQALQFTIMGEGGQPGLGLITPVRAMST